MSSKILEKQVNSDVHIHDGAEDLDSDRKTDKVQELFYGTNNSQQSPEKALVGKQVKMSFPPPTKKKIQLTFEDVVIKTIPQQRKCCKKGPVEQSKVILNNVSGTVKPGQFLAIIGASGKLFPQLHSIRCDMTSDKAKLSGVSLIKISQSDIVLLNSDYYTTFNTWTNRTLTNPFI